MIALHRRGILLLSLALSAGCEQRMNDQPRYEPLEAAARFENNQAAQHPPAHTVSRDAPQVTDQPPETISLEDLERGQERFRIYCAPCHGELGHGEGPVVARGFPRPPSYHIDRLRRAPLRYFYQVISEGQGNMYSYADRVDPADRWRIALYIRALQYSAPQPLEEYLRAPLPRDTRPPESGP